MVNSFLDPVLGWLLYLHPAIAILLISLLVSAIITLALKFLTNQSLMKDMKQELKELQKQMKELRNNPNKLAKINSRFMETNMKYMSHSLRPTLYTFIPIILVFGWLNSHLGYYPLLPEEPFEVRAAFDKDEVDPLQHVTLELPDSLTAVDGPRYLPRNHEVLWVVKGAQGEHTLSVSYKEGNYPMKLLITTERAYEPVEKSFRSHFLFFSSPNEDGLDKITLGNRKVIPFEDVPVLQSIPWVSTWSWFGVYIVFSIAFSMLLRRVFNVY
jgi:uncharacterized membrane protein (DUF106 family)